MHLKPGAAAVGLVLATSAAIGLGTGAANAARAPYGCGAEIYTDHANVAAGEHIHLLLHCYGPREGVSLYFASTIERLADVVTDPNGDANVGVTIPAGSTCGIHHLIGTGNQGHGASITLAVGGSCNPVRNS